MFLTVNKGFNQRLIFPTANNGFFSIMFLSIYYFESAIYFFVS